MSTNTSAPAVQRLILVEDDRNGMLSLPPSEVSPDATIYGIELTAGAGRDQVMLELPHDGGLTRAVVTGQRELRLTPQALRHLHQLITLALGVPGGPVL